MTRIAPVMSGGVWCGEEGIAGWVERGKVRHRQARLGRVWRELRARLGDTSMGGPRLGKVRYGGDFRPGLVRPAIAGLALFWLAAAWMENYGRIRPGVVVLGWVSVRRERSGSDGYWLCSTSQG